MDERVESLLQRHQDLESDRSTWEAHWREIAERVLPRQKGFNEVLTPGEKRQDKIFDGTPELALIRYASAMESMLTPRTQRWAKLQAQAMDLVDDIEIRRYFDELNEIMFRIRYAPKANFQSSMHENYMGLGAFGTGCLFIDEAVGTGIRYRQIHLGELYLAEDHTGRIDTVHRKFEYTARQAVQAFGMSNLPPKIADAAEKGDKKKFCFVHCVSPNEDRKMGNRDYRGMPISSYYMSLDERAIISEGGYRTMPYAVSRYVKSPTEVYGRSPAMSALADIKMLNEIEKTVLRQAHRITDPPLLLQDDGALRAFSVRPNALNYGALDGQGNPRVRPMDTQGNLNVGLEVGDRKRQQVNEHFLVNLFQILVENPQMTATEALIRAQEKGQLIAPVVGRQQSELLGAVIERELDILSQVPGLLPEMPKALRDAGGEYAIEYTSPINRAMRAEDGVAIMRTLEAVTPWAQIDPTVLDAFDPEMVVRELAEVNGMPAKTIRDAKTIAALRAQREQQINAQQLLAAMPAMSQSAKNIAQAAAVDQSAGPVAGVA